MRRNKPEEGLLTFDDSTQEPGDSPYLCQVVGGEVVVAGCVGMFGVAEDHPQLGRLSAVLHDFHLCASFKLLVPQRSVSQQTHTMRGEV